MKAGADARHMTKSEALARVADAIDIETFLVCETEEEAKEACLALLEALGLREGSVVFCEFNGPGARVRLRSYLSRPGKEYPWLRVAIQNPRGGFVNV